MKHRLFTLFVMVCILLCIMSFSSDVEAGGKYWIKVKATVTGPFAADAEITTNIPYAVVFSLSLALSGLKPNDTFIGTDFIRVPIVEGKGNATVDGSRIYVLPYGSRLPTGKYNLEASFHPRWSENSVAAAKLGITDSIEGRAIVKLGAADNSTNTEEKAIKKKNAKSKHDKESCYQLGFRYGRCGVMALKGFTCDPKDDIVMPVECRGLSETDRGTRDGTKSVW